MADDAMDQPKTPAGTDGAATGLAEEPEVVEMGYESADPALLTALWHEAAALRESS